MWYNAVCFNSSCNTFSIVINYYCIIYEMIKYEKDKIINFRFNSNETIFISWINPETVGQLRAKDGEL